MNNRTERIILNHVAQARAQADAIIVVGIMPGGRFFFDCDNRITIPDLHGVLQDSIDRICENLAHVRAHQAKEGK